MSLVKKSQPRSFTFSRYHTNSRPNSQYTWYQSSHNYVQLSLPYEIKEKIKIQKN